VMLRFIAVVVLLAVAETSCRSARGYLDRGNKLYDSGKLEEAALNYRKAIQRNPKLSEAYYRLGLTESKQGNSQQAYAALSHAVQLQPGDDRIQVALADLELADYLTDRRHLQWVYSQLTKFSDEALKKNPNSFDGLRVKGYLALTDRKLDDALEYFRKANQVKPMDPNLIQVYTQALIQTGNAQEAERLALALIQKQKSYLPIYGVLYRQYMATHRPSDAEGILKIQVDNNPKQALCVLELAGHYHRTGKTEEMTSMLQRLLDHPKDFPQAHAQVGDFYAGIGMMEQAQRQYQAGMLSDPARKIEYQMRMARVMEAQGKRDEAVGVLDQVTKNRPKDEAAQTVRANLLLESGKPEKVDAALQAFQALVDKKPEDPERRFNLGRAYLAKGNLERAQGQFREAILRRPGYVAPGPGGDQPEDTELQRPASLRERSRGSRGGDSKSAASESHRSDGPGTVHGGQRGAEQPASGGAAIPRRPAASRAAVHCAKALQRSGGTLPDAASRVSLRAADGGGPGGNQTPAEAVR
jgi:tetratricopeptide (TPR) repeat protein